MNILISMASSLITLLVFMNVPASWFSFNSYLPQNLGSTITTITDATNLADFPAIYNADLSSLNSTKLEDNGDIASTLSIGSTTIGRLTATSTITFSTALTAANGGTGTTSPTSNQVMIGNGSSGLKVIGFGSSGQFLTSAGAGSAPSWTTAAIDTAASYTWTGHHIFSSLFATIASTTNATSTTSHYFPFLTSTLLKTDSAGKLTAATADVDYISSTKFTATTTQAVFTGSAAGTLWSKSVPGGTLSTNNGLKGRFYVSWNSQSTTAKNIDLNYGGTDCASASTGALPAATSITAKGYIEFLIIANAATGAQVCSVQFQLFENEGGVGGTDEAYLLAADDGTAAADSTSAQTLSLTFDHNSSGDSLTVLHGIVEYVR